MEIYQLEYIVAIARHRNFTRAAEEMCVSQSTLSQQVKKLEDEVGVKLFDRKTHEVLPTAAGQALLSYARIILDAAGAAVQSLSDYRKLTKGTLNLGSIRTAEFMGFFDIVSAFHQNYPGIQLRILQSGSYRIIELLRALEIHIGILFPPLDDDSDDIEYHVLAESESVLLARSDNPVAASKTVDLGQLAGEDFIFPTVDQEIYHMYKQACQKAGFSPKIVCESGACAATIALIGAGMGVAILPEGVVKSGVPAGISVVRLTAPIKTNVALAMLKRPYHSPPAIAFKDFALKAGLN